MISTELIKALSADEINIIKSIISQKAVSVKQNQIDLGNYFEEYAEYAKITFSHKYCISIKTAFQHLLEHLGEEKQLNEISVKDIDSFILKLSVTAPRGIKVYIRTLKSAFNKAIDWEYINTNPFTKCKVSKQMQLKPDFLNEDEMSKIIENIKNKAIREIVIAAFYTGARLNEILSLKIKNIDFENNLIIIGDESFQTKNRKQRVIPISDRLKKILTERIGKNIKTDSYVFTKQSNYKYSGDYISKKFKRACRDAGIRETIHFHSLRHSFGSFLGQKGVPMITVKELMGHSSITTTQIYSHTTVNDMKEAIKKFN